jgi:hypothetical protein
MSAGYKPDWWEAQREMGAEEPERYLGRDNTEMVSPVPRGALQPTISEAKPPKHKFWGAGEDDCPADIKARNGELHSLRCKVCGETNPRDQFCWKAAAALANKEPTNG